MRSLLDKLLAMIGLVRKSENDKYRKEVYELLLRQLYANTKKENNNTAKH